MKHYHLVQMHAGSKSQLTEQILEHKHKGGHKRHSHKGMIGYGKTRSSVRR